MRQRQELQRFERLVMPYLAAGYNLARWLTRNDHDAEDVVQEACMRALASFDRYRGGDPRAWLLTIVRNTCYTWLRRNRRPEAACDGDTPDESWSRLPGDPGLEPEAQIIRNADTQLLREELQGLPVEFRETLVLRELEGLSYKEIADITNAPLGTVMSRLARARRQLQHALGRRLNEERKE